MTRSSWSRPRRVVAKAEWTRDEANPRFIVTSLSRAEEGRHLYEKVYCARGDMENRIKECQLDLYRSHLTATFRANQLRLWFFSVAYVCCAPCAASPCTTRRSPKRPAAPFVSSCSRSVRSCASASAASRLRWRQRVRQPIPGAALPSVSPLPPTRGPRPPDTRRRNA